MTIYVHSRGKSQEHDHSWLSEDGQTSKIPEALIRIKPEELIDSHKPSIILARSRGELILLVTALITRDGRTDFMRRQIRNVVAWVKPDESNSRRMLCKIAAQALYGELDGVVDESVESDADNQYGFGADFELLRSIGGGLDGQNDAAEQSGSGSDLKIGGNSQGLRQELADELTEHGLPKSTGDPQILVVVTTLKSAAGLKSKNVWRGLSSRIEDEEWITYSDSKKKQNLILSRQNKMIIGLTAILTVVLIAVIAWLIDAPAHQKMPSQVPVTEQVSPVVPSPIL